MHRAATVAGLALIALVSTGCTTRSWYEGLQSSAALECNRRPGSDREACPGNAADLDRALVAIGASGAQGLVVANNPFFVDKRAKLVQFAAYKRLPAVFFFKLFVDAGGLMAYGPSLESSYRRAATYVDKILKGAKPAELPVELPTRFELAINRGAARTLGLVIPQSLLLQADYVVE